MKTILENKKCASVKQIDFQKHKRVIVISDIHGDYDGFLGVLEKTGFSDEDALVVIGDMIERGTRSLDLLHLIMDYDKKENVYILMGNNEAFFLSWCDGAFSDEGMYGYLRSKDNSIMIEMARQLGLAYKTVEQMTVLRQAICVHYETELQYLRSLPQIFDSEYAVFVHAGLQPGDIRTQDYEYCLTAPAFHEQTHSFAKKVIVGHWPASNYCEKKIDANVRINQATNVISIDGGNSMKSWQQINYLILNPRNGEVQSGYYDSLPKVKVLENQRESEEIFSLVFPNTQIESICEVQAERSLCYFASLKKEIWIDKDRIYDYKGHTYSFDFTTYDLPVCAGEIVSFCGKTRDGIWIKRDGIVGNYRGAVLFL